MKRLTRLYVTAVALAFFLLAAASHVGMAARVQITFATYLSSLGTVENWSKLVKAYTDTNPDIDVDVQVYPFDDYVNKIVTMTAGGIAPDVFQTWAQYKAKWVEEGLVRDLTNQWEKSANLKKARIYPFMQDVGKYNGKIYGVPYDFNSVVWFYNRDLMAARGVVEPNENWTVDDLRNLAKKLTDPEAMIYGTSNPINSGSGGNIQWMHNWTGHEWLSEDRSKVLVDQPAAIESLEYWNDLQNNLKLAPYPGGYAARGTFYEGGYGIVENWLSGVFVAATSAQFDWGYTTPPRAPLGQRAFAQGHMFSVANGTKHADAAWSLVEWMAGYDGQKATVNAMLRQPIGPYADLWDVFFQRLGAAQGAAMRDWVLNTFYGKDLARNMTYWTTYPEMSAIMAEHVNRIFSSGAPAGNEMISAAQRMRALIK